MGKNNKNKSSNKHENITEVQVNNKFSFKSFLLKFAKFAVFAVLFVTIFNYTNYVLRDKSKTEAIALNLEKPNGTYDVILVGPSHMQYAIQPAQLFGEYGIASCNMGSTAQSIPTSYYVIKDMINRHEPELVVLDLFCVFYPEANFSPTRFHQAMDSFPLSVNKAQAINDLVEKDDRAEFYINYLLYHGRWKELQRYDYKAFQEFNETYQMREGVQKFETPFVPVDSSLTEPLPSMSEEYLKKIVDLCKETDTELLLTVIPYRADVDNNNTSAEVQQKYYNRIQYLSHEWDVDYLNGLHYLSDMNFDFVTDMLEYSHVNASGAEKVTDFYGEYFRNNYEIPERRSDDKYKDWFNDYAEYYAELNRITNN